MTVTLHGHHGLVHVVDKGGLSFYLPKSQWVLRSNRWVFDSNPTGPYSPEGFRASRLIAGALEGSTVATPFAPVFTEALCHGGASTLVTVDGNVIPEGGPWLIRGGESDTGQIVPPFLPSGQAVGSLEIRAPIIFEANVTLTGSTVTVVSGQSPPTADVVTPGAAGC